MTVTSVVGRREANLPACTVASHGQPMALLALSDISVLALASHGVGRGELMPLIAMGTGSLEMRPVANQIKVVLGDGAVDDVSRSVVELIPVLVPSNEARRAGSMEDQGYELVDSEVPDSTSIPVEDHPGVTLVVQRGRQELPVDSVLAVGEHLSPGIDPVATEITRNVYPWKVIHGREYTPTKNQVKGDFS